MLQKSVLFWLSFFIFGAWWGCGQASRSSTTNITSPKDNTLVSNSLTTENDTNKMANTEKATFGAGCFWCVEAVFQQLRGVERVQSGYSGGTTKNPSYKEVCTGKTGHAEVLEIIYDPSVISYAELLDVFWHIHDPTQLNRQGNDIGTQYRSAVYYHSEAQRQLAEQSKADLDKSGYWGAPIVTEITAAQPFYPAEDYHTDYFNLHGEEPYCSAVVAPKVAKFRKNYADKLKQ